MKKTTNIFFLYKVAERNHLQTLINGKVFFSCCGNYVEIAKRGKDKGQGDKYECVFAKYLKGNSEEPIRKYKSLFGKDLLIEKEGNYVLFRRKSSLLTPTACFYSMDNETTITNLKDNDRERIEKVIEENSSKESFPVDNFPLTIPQKYLDEFDIKKDSIDAAIIQPRDFLKKLSYKGIKYHKIVYIDTNREYDIFKEELFKEIDASQGLTDAIENKMEIFFKDKNNYSHQCEFRCYIPDITFQNYNRHKQVRIKGLTTLDSLKSHNTNATGYDLIYNVKNGDFYATVIMHKEE